MLKLNNVDTEKRNELSLNLDKLSTIEAVNLMNSEDEKVAEAVGLESEKIAQAIDVIIDQFNQGGRLIYMGAGTSGRLGILDAAECPPTFSTDPGKVIGLIAGGQHAIQQAIENSEDNHNQAVEDLKSIQLTDKDVVVGLAASGRTPYVIGGLKYAKAKGVPTISVACTSQSEIGEIADIKIEVVVGPEVLTGSTRLKAATAQKMVLNMLSTISMVGIGKVYQNLMVDVSPTNEKLRERAKQIVIQSTSCSYEEAQNKLKESKYEVKPAIISILLGISIDESLDKLNDSEGFVNKTLENNQTL